MQSRWVARRKCATNRTNPASYDYLKTILGSKTCLGGRVGKDISMYNGTGNGSYPGGPSNIGGFRIKPMYLYVVMGLVILAAIYLVWRFIETNIIIHFGLFAGALLLIANVREFFGSPAAGGSLPLLNTLIGGALICAWISQFLFFFWIPTLVLIGVATPLTLGRASVYSIYIQTAKSAVNSVRRVSGR